MVKLFKFIVPLMSCLVWICFASDATESLKAAKSINTGINVPPKGKIRLFIGQDNESIYGYTKNIDVPITGFTLYTGYARELEGTQANADWGAGRMNFKEALKKYPNVAIAMAVDFMEFVTRDPKSFVEKQEKFKEVTKKLITYLKEDTDITGRQIFLRIGYEFEGEWNNYNPKDYCAAFQYVKKEVVKAGLDNVALVWQAASYPPITYSEKMVASWYPGDQYVDWVGISTFFFDKSYKKQFSCVDKSIANPHLPSKVYDLFVDFAKKHNKPLMICESSSKGMDTEVGSVACTWGGTDSTIIYPMAQETVGHEQIWDTWFQEFFDYIYANKKVIRAVAYINADWDSQNMWKCADHSCPIGYWGDTRVEANELIKKRWIGEISKKVWAK